MEDSSEAQHNEFEQYKEQSQLKLSELTSEKSATEEELQNLHAQFRKAQDEYHKKLDNLTSTLTTEEQTTNSVRRELSNTIQDKANQITELQQQSQLYQDQIKTFKKTIDEREQFFEQKQSQDTQHAHD